MLSRGKSRIKWILLITTIFLFLVPVSGATAKNQYTYIYPTDSCTSRYGWSDWDSMTWWPGQTRTISWSPRKAGNHSIQFQTTTMLSYYSVRPKWIGPDGSGYWGPYTRYGTNPLTISLATGSSNIRYEFAVTEELDRLTTIYVRTYCEP